MPGSSNDDRATDVDLDALGAHLDCGADEGYVFDVVHRAARQAAAIGDVDRIVAGDELVPNPTRFIPILPMNYRQGLALKSGFATTQAPPVRDALIALLGRAAPGPAFEQRLTREPALRTAWETYRGRLLRAYAQEWLCRHAPALAFERVADPQALQLVKSLPPDAVDSKLVRQRRVTTLCTQLLACGFAAWSAAPASRWIWLTALSLLLAGVLRAVRSALQCRSGPRSLQAMCFALIEAGVGLLLGGFFVFLLLGIFRDGMPGEGSIWNSVTLQRYLWSDPLLWPSTVLLSSVQVVSFWVLLPRLRTDLPRYPWDGWSETYGQWIGFVIGLSLGACLAVASADGQWIAIAMAVVVVAIEWGWLSLLPGPELRPATHR